MTRLGVAAVLTTAATLGITATPAFAACGSKCDGKNPASYTYLDTSVGGPGATVLCQTDAKRPSVSGKVYKKLANPNLGENSAYVELRYSPTCRTAWARTNAYQWTVYVVSYNANGSYRTQAEQVTNSTVKWSAMVNDAGMKAKACLVVPVSEPDLCTDLY
ncbi:DUF2690 domain-containing protein [Actinoplanes sp. CA-252034]|uniref:DUF2690 domain-containing protein n=1 Tax=Actinoplanes sp. CA-252034 TaxID=3239906 RepID=UPI003D962127